MKTKKKVSRKKVVIQEGGLIPGIGFTFRNRRFEKKMSLQDVAEKSGITYLTISKLEKGELKNLSFTTLEAIAGALGLKVLVNCVE
jgi:DNA-binding Xre family transcriptional regulator